MKTLKIEFEGTDGAGKTTGLKYFIERAKSRGLSVVETREVGNPNVSACVELREFVLFKHKELSGQAQELIFSAMRFENDKWFRQLIESKDAPNLVVSDRGWFSHLAYTDHNVSKEFTNTLYNNVLKNSTLLPDVVIYFSVDTNTALKRRVKRGTEMDVIEMKGIEYQEKVRESFQTRMNESIDNSERITIFDVDANQNIEQVQEQLNTILDQLANLTNAL